MSSPWSNLSYNLVDWDLHVRLAAAMDAGPAALEDALRGLSLSPEEDDERTVRLFDEGRFPTLLHFHVLVPGLRWDAERFRPMAARLLREEREREEDWGLVTSALSQLAFVNGSTRMYGDVWLVEPLTLLAAFSARFAAWSSDGTSPGETRDALELAMGFHDAATAAFRRGPDEAGRGIGAVLSDLVLPPDVTGALARDLAPLRVPDALRGDLARVRREVATYAPALLEQAAEIAEPGQDPLEAWLAESLREIVALFARAATEGRGVDVSWHANP